MQVDTDVTHVINDTHLPLEVTKNEVVGRPGNEARLVFAQGGFVIKSKIAINCIR